MVWKLPLLSMVASYWRTSRLDMRIATAISFSPVEPVPSRVNLPVLVSWGGVAVKITRVALVAGREVTSMNFQVPMTASRAFVSAVFFSDRPNTW